MNTKKQRYFAEIDQVGKNTFKVKFAQKLVKVNQHSRSWKHANARNFARMLNRGDLIIK